MRSISRDTGRRQAGGTGFDAVDRAALGLWRHADPSSFAAADATRVRRALGGTVLIHHPRWPAALRGDGAAAVAVALETMRRPAATVVVDLAMSALLLRAAEGDGAAALVLAHAAAVLPRRRQRRASAHAEQRRSFSR